MRAWSRDARKIVLAGAALAFLGACAQAPAMTSAAAVASASAAPAAAATTMPSPDASLAPYQIRAVAPDIPFYDAQEKRHTLSEFKGRVTFLIFFANYCTYCQKEVPHLQAFQAAHPDVNVVPVEATGANAQVVADFAQSFKVTIPLYHDTQRAGAQSFLVTNYPNIFTLTPGQVVETSILGNASDAYYENMSSTFGGGQ